MEGPKNGFSFPEIEVTGRWLGRLSTTYARLPSALQMTLLRKSTLGLQPKMTNSAALKPSAGLLSSGVRRSRRADFPKKPSRFR